MKALTFGICLVDPVLIGSVDRGDPNSASSLDYIPGSTLRGMLVSRYLRDRRKTDVDAEDREFRDLFLGRRVLFLNAYPESPSGNRSLPVPLSWRVEKDALDPILDFAVSGPKPSETSWKKPDCPFCDLFQREEEALTQLVKPATRINIHHARADRQNTTGKGSTVFRYLAMDSHQVFHGAVLGEEEDLLVQIKELLEASGFFFLGKSHLAGYGRVQAREVQMVESWSEYAPSCSEESSNAGALLAVTLLSDALVRNPSNGEWTLSLDSVLGAVHREAFVGRSVAGGFNRKWGLPLPQAPAIKAGSVFIYEANEPFLQHLKKLEAEGIGERRNEGFGRIAVNWQASAEISVLSPAVPLPRPVQLKGAAAQLAHQMTNRMQRRRLDRALIETINQHVVSGRPRNAQLSRLRVVLREALREKSPAGVFSHLDGLKGTAGEQFRRARVGGLSFYEWIEERMKKPEDIWGILKIQGARSVETIAVGDIRPELTGALALEYSLRLVEGIVQRALKEEKGRAYGPQGGKSGE